MSSDVQVDAVAFMVACAGEDMEGVIALMEQIGVDPTSRAGSMLAGIAGFAIGMTMQLLVEMAGVAPDKARAAARDMIISWHRGEFDK